MPTTTTTPLEILQNTFGYEHFRGAQADIIEHLLAGGDALVLMPTGGGKSLCYQIPALLRSGVAIVVSPLIALMQDQVTALNQLGIAAAGLHSGLSFERAQAVSQQLRQGHLDLLYIAPERLLTEHFLSFLDTLEVALFAIDEAHCVSQWGHDFRPDYVQLSLLHQRYPQVPCIALTATADATTRGEIINRLGLQQAKVFVASFDRPNIRYLLEPKRDNARQQLLNFINREHQGDSGIIYCLSRRRVEEIALYLQDEGWNAWPYHAGLPAEVRQHNQDRFLCEDGIVMVATIAFGMGIDKPNVRFVAHLDMPKSIEAYYQETGRAGRDGQPADAWMAYGYKDVVTLRQLLDSSNADDQHKWVERQKLEALLGYCETTQCRRQILLSYFGDELPQPCGNCDACLYPIATWDATEAAQKALSCIYRTRQRFGASYLIDILLGRTHKLRYPEHEQLSTFGIGKELREKQWQSVFRQLIAAGYVTVELESYGSLRLAEKARPVLRGEQQVRLRQDDSPAKSTKPTRKAVNAQFSGEDKALWEALKAKRLEIAQAQGVAPFQIFHDSTLADMVVYRPDTLIALGHIHGIGQVKLHRYGQQFLTVIDAHEMV